MQSQAGDGGKIGLTQSNIRGIREEDVTKPQGKGKWTPSFPRPAKKGHKWKYCGYFFHFHSSAQCYCLFVGGISLMSSQLIIHLFPDCLKVVLLTSCFVPQGR